MWIMIYNNFQNFSRRTELFQLKTLFERNLGLSFSFRRHRHRMNVYEWSNPFFLPGIDTITRGDGFYRERGQDSRGSEGSQGHSRKWRHGLATEMATVFANTTGMRYDEAARPRCRYTRSSALVSRRPQEGCRGSYYKGSRQRRWVSSILSINRLLKSISRKARFKFRNRPRSFILFLICGGVAETQQSYA